MGLNGAVTSGHPLASQAGIRILQAGGNAVDAAIATAAALGVVELPSSGVGGDGFIMLYDRQSRKVHGINGTGPAPAAATRDFYVERGGIPMKGALSVSVPGLVDGWMMAHRPFGKLGLLEVLTPAIELCEQGFPISHKLSATLYAEHQQFSSDPYTSAIFEPDGRPLDPGELLFQRDLGQTLRAIAAGGRDAFYEGEIAREVVRVMEACDGLITLDDLSFNARWDEPIYVDYCGHRVYEMPPNSSGHILLQELNLIEQFDIPSMGCLTAESVHIMVEAKKLAFADRETHMADPDFRDVPIDRLLSKEYAAERAALIDPTRASTEVTTGIPEAKEDTTCFTVADGEGNVVCMLQSIQSSLGSSMIAGNTGILLNNRMTYWHLDEGHPNCLVPGRRVRHTMNPVIALKLGKPVIICGTPGADTQVQTNLQLEARFGNEVRKGLEKRGHALQILADWGGPGNAQFIRREPESGALLAGVDPRQDGYAIAY